MCCRVLRFGLVVIICCRVLSWVCCWMCLICWVRFGVLLVGYFLCCSVRVLSCLFVCCVL